MDLESTGFTGHRWNVGMSKYVLITPARNEELFIRKTISCVLAQTLKPSRWVIVDDGSTDRTAEIVAPYVTNYSFISLLKIQSRAGRSFGKKVAAFNAGLSLLKKVDCAFVGNLDADVSLAPDYYENIIAEFERDSRLGIAGGIVYTKIGRKFISYDSAPDSVGGAIQLFRKKCFDQVGGYLALKYGGVDAAAEIIARMKGWKVKKFPEHLVWEYRRTGSAEEGIVQAKYKEGARFHSLGYSPLFYLLRSAYKLNQRPFVIGSTLALLGFLSAKARRYPVCLPPDAVSYLRSEQAGKLRHILFGSLSKTTSLWRAAHRRFWRS